MRKLISCVTAALVLTAASCGGKNKLYPVSGKVTYNGAPASGAIVFLARSGATEPPTILGVVQADGSFELVCGARGKGAPPGEYDVLIEWKRVPRQGRRAQAGPDLLGGRYADPQQPLLHATVESKAMTLPPIELVDAGPAPKRPFGKQRR